MTGFASTQGQGLGYTWIWDLRSVNGKGLDVRVRLPDWIEGLESYVRETLGKKILRGNVQVGLKIASTDGESALRLDENQLAGILSGLAQIEAKADTLGLDLGTSTAAQIMGLKGVLTTEAQRPDSSELGQQIRTDFLVAIEAFCDMRAREGAEMGQILYRQVKEIEDLVTLSEAAAAARLIGQQEKLRAQMAQILETSDPLDEARIAQELALLVVKSDVTEEIDRLRAHVSAARDLLDSPGAIGRKLDFLMQEFNREANTLCSKSGDPALTQHGLALKTVIDQMREQVQNVE
ncbi:MAG: YicC family protein [Pelagimonas sp.]|jgi:uncharacterized protein (TIGR00255 family)|nr:YicC family protein [Pelagimonas sp.]